MTLHGHPAVNVRVNVRKHCAIHVNLRCQMDSFTSVANKQYTFSRKLIIKNRGKNWFDLGDKITDKLISKYPGNDVVVF